jgi:Peptidase family S41/N-terminal domain of Peptidase_S41 in eukaryotic IRBP
MSNLISERIYAWLLRLYPARFRAEYGGEALQLFRDRVRDETGLFAKGRLWLDLLTDLAISVPAEYVHLQPSPIGAALPSRVAGAPCFFVLEGRSLGPGALLWGSVVTLAALSTFAALVGGGGVYVRILPNAAARQVQQSRVSRQPASQSPQRNKAAAENASASGISSLDSAERKRIVETAADIVRKHYKDKDAGQKMADALLHHEWRGDNDAVANAAVLAALLTQQMRDVAPDRHLKMEYSRAPLPERPTEPTSEERAAYREAMKRQNCSFEQMETLPRNIGYVKLNWFPDFSVCQITAASVMASLNHNDAIIFDLRDNRGGDPAMVMFLAAYFFDHPEYMYNPKENTSVQSWTHSPVPGSTLADKPLYVLTSSRTYSAAEHFSYDLKMLKRATLVGETTGGGAHSGVWHRIDAHFGLGVPETNSINPYAEPDWAEIGVTPDVRVNSGDALATAEKLALRKRHTK